VTVSCGVISALVFVLAVSAACATRGGPMTGMVTPPAATTKPATPPPVTPAPTTVVPGAAASDPLVGMVTREDLKNYAPWEGLFSRGYSPDPAAVASIRANAKDVAVLLVLGTWCPDAKREVPRYFAIMDEVGIGDKTLTSVAVDRSKKDAVGLTEKWGITRVPTFVFLRKGQEVGRIVESVPAGSTLEAEIAKILSAR